MNVTGWLELQRQPTLFPAARRNGSLKRLVGKLLAIANAGAGHGSGSSLVSIRETFYAFKSKLLERFGQPCGTDWQEITQPCFGCEDCGFHRSRFDGWSCGGTRIYSRKFVPLARTRLGGHVFHTPGQSQTSRPDGPIAFRGRIVHREVDDEQARAAFLQLCLMFDRDLFRQFAGKLFSVEMEETPY